MVSEDGAWGSQVDTVTCYVGNKIIGKSKENQSEFLITQTSKSGEGVPEGFSKIGRASCRERV